MPDALHFVVQVLNQTRATKCNRHLQIRNAIFKLVIKLYISCFPIKCADGLSWSKKIMSHQKLKEARRRNSFYFFAYERFKIFLHLNVKIRYKSSYEAGGQNPNRENL